MMAAGSSTNVPNYTAPHSRHQAPGSPRLQEIETSGRQYRAELLQDVSVITCWGPPHIDGRPSSGHTCVWDLGYTNPMQQSHSPSVQQPGCPLRSQEPTSSHFHTELSDLRLDFPRDLENFFLNATCFSNLILLHLFSQTIRPKDTNHEGPQYAIFSLCHLIWYDVDICRYEAYLMRPRIFLSTSSTSGSTPTHNSIYAYVNIWDACVCGSLTILSAPHTI
jgi:hypothetical protein